MLVALLICVLAGIHDGLVVYASWNRHLLSGHAGLLLMVALTDLLTRNFRERELELKRSVRALESKRTALFRARDEAIRKEQLQAVGELGAIIAHEVRNPLAILKNAVSGIRRSAGGTNDTTLLDIIDEECGRLAHLSDDLKTYAQPLTIFPEPLNIRDVIEVSIAQACAREHDEPIEVRMDDRSETSRMQGDQDLLERALAHVMTNALQATRDHGRVTIEAKHERSEDGSFVRIRIRDDGPGMSQEVLQKAMDPFYTNRPSGTGLGLTISARVIRAHGGSLHIQSEVGKGTQVDITLPTEPAIQ
jgi:signal transduction histidine kinase